MTWKFDIVASKDARLLSRILQAFENQMVDIQSLQSQSSGGTVRITCVISSGQDKAYRLKALLYRVHNVCSVQVAEIELAKSTQAMAIFKAQKVR